MTPGEIREEIKRILGNFTPEQQEMIFRLFRLALDYREFGLPL